MSAMIGRKCTIRRFAIHQLSDSRFGVNRKRKARSPWETEPGNVR